MSSPTQSLATVQAMPAPQALELARRFGTPLYVYYADVIRSQIQRLRGFDVIRYAQKANSNLAILDLMRRENVLLDAVSAGEILRGLTAGFAATGTPPPIVYTADVFDSLSLQSVLDHDIHCNLGSPDMIDQLGQRRAGSEITLRLNPGFGHGHSNKTNTGGENSKHGIWFSQLGECVDRAERYNLEIVGLHMHIGSGVDFEHLTRVCESMSMAAKSLHSTLRSVSAGGGLPVAYREDETTIDVTRYTTMWKQTRDKIQAELGREIRLECEPGRFVVAQSGYLVSEIRAVKQMGHNTFYLLDAGFNNLLRPAMYGSFHPMWVVSRDGATAGPSKPVVVGGPLCESGDIFTQLEGGAVCHRELPPAEVGDLLVIGVAGAYGFCMSSNYNSKPFAAEVLVDGDKAQLVRQRQTPEDLIRGEIVPGT